MKISMDATTLRDALKAVSGLVDEVKITIKTDGLGITAMDKSNIAMVILNLPKTSALEWETEATGEMDEILVMELTGLLSVLKRTDKTDVVTLTSDGGRLDITLTGGRRYKIPLLDSTETPEQKLPKLEHKFEVVMTATKLADAIEDCAITNSDSIEFIGTKTSFVFRSEGDTKLSIAEVTMPGTAVKIETNEEKIRCKYSIEYLNKMMPAGFLKTGTNVNVKLKTGNDYPLMLEYHAERFDVSFLLAPRVSND